MLIKSPTGYRKRELTFLRSDDNSRASAFATTSRASIASKFNLLFESNMVSLVREASILALDTPSTGVIRCRLEDSESSSSSYITSVNREHKQVNDSPEVA